MPPMPIVPCGVQVRGGLYFDAVSRQRGSSGIMNGKPGQKPSEATQYSVPECTRTNCCTSARPLASATYSGSQGLSLILAR